MLRAGMDERGTFGDNAGLAMTTISNGMQPMGELHPGNYLGAVVAHRRLREPPAAVRRGRLSAAVLGDQGMQKRAGHEWAPAAAARRRLSSLAGRVAARLALVFAFLVLAVGGAGGCSRRLPNATPDGAVRELVERLQRVHGDPSDAKAAYLLLSKRAQLNLTARAQRYSAASGKTIAPEAMIVPSRFLLRFEPQRFTAQIAGAHALVEVVGLLPQDRALVPCVFEDGAWRVDLALPALPPVQMRPGNSG